MISIPIIQVSFMYILKSNVIKRIKISVTTTSSITIAKNKLIKYSSLLCWIYNRLTENIKTERKKIKNGCWLNSVELTW